MMRPIPLVVAGKGIGAVMLGMPLRHVLKLWPNYARVEEDPLDSMTTAYYGESDLDQVVLSFDPKEDERLVRIDVPPCDFVWDGKLIGENNHWPTLEILMVEQKLYMASLRGFPSEENPLLWYCDYSTGDDRLCVYVEGVTVKGLQFNVAKDNHGNLLWPETE